MASESAKQHLAAEAAQLQVRLDAAHEHQAALNLTVNGLAKEQEGLQEQLRKANAQVRHGPGRHESEPACCLLLMMPCDVGDINLGFKY